MFTIAMRTVFVGEPPFQAAAILTRLGNIGFGSYAVDSLKEGHDLVEGGGFELVLSLEKLKDGNGYDLASPVMRQGGSLFIGVETSVGCLWLPVIDHGEKVLGASAIDYRLLEMELADVLTHRSARGTMTSRWVPPAPPKTLAMKPTQQSPSIVVAKEERRQRQIAIMPVAKTLTRSLRLSVAKSIETQASVVCGPETQVQK